MGFDYWLDNLVRRSFVSAHKFTGCQLLSFVLLLKIDNPVLVVRLKEVDPCSDFGFKPFKVCPASYESCLETLLGHDSIIIEKE